MPARPTVVVIGGGITGLAAAHRLEELSTASKLPLRVVLLEASEHLGGKLRGAQIDGCIVDAAADIFVASKPAAQSLCARVGISSELVFTEPSCRRTFVREGDQLIAASHYADEELLTPRGGMQRLPDAVAAALQRVEVFTSTAVSRLHRRQGALNIVTPHGDVHADAVIVAVPAAPAARLLRALAPEAADLLAEVPYRAATTVSVLLGRHDCPHDLNGYGYLVRNAGAGEVSACTWTSSKIPGRAPRDTALLRYYINAGSDLPATTIASLVRDELQRGLGVRAAPRAIRSFSWDDAIPVHAPSEVGRPPAVARALQSQGAVVVAGGALAGVGIPDAITSGEHAATSTFQSLYERATSDVS